MDNKSQRALCRLADQLLKKSGYANDGTRLRGRSKKQVFFENKTIIKTPMGNHR
jgi:hypothetical protein